VRYETEVSKKEPHTDSRENRVPKKTASTGKKKTAGSGKKKVHKVMSEYKHGGLKSSSGRKVKSRKQAVAIALNEARSSGAKIPKKKAKS
jgi:hypothetical protein